MRQFIPSFMTSGREIIGESNLRRYVPSLFAEAAHESRSERYAYVPTFEVLKGLQNEGFRVFGASQSRTRIPGKAEFTKHMLRLRHVSQMNRAAVVGDSVGEIVLINSHDGTSSYQMMGGMFRFVCCNGMVVPAGVCETVKIQHSGDIKDRVTQGAYDVLDGLTRVIEHKDDMRAITLDRQEQKAFADAALMIRFDVETPAAAPVTAEQLLQVRRCEDDKQDLWSTFNRVQENAIKGGLQGRTASGQRRATRAVTGIDSDVKVNRALWQLAEAMKALKS